MHLLFVDESGTPPKPGQRAPRYFVVGGVIIPEGAWHRIRDAMLGLKVRRRLRGEFKWRYFSATNDERRNPMRGLDQTERDSIRRDLIRIVTADNAITCLACVGSAAAAYELGNVNTQEDLYHGTYKPVTERLQYHLQDLSRLVGARQLGVVIADHRGQQDDKRLRGHHQKLLHSTGEFISTYKNLVEGLFLEPSHLSVGIQLADLVAGAVWRKFERNDTRWFDLLEPRFRRNAQGEIAGYGLVKFPTRGWR